MEPLEYKIQFNYNHEPKLWHEIETVPHPPPYTLEEACEKFEELKQHGEWLMSRMQIVNIQTCEVVASHEMNHSVSAAVVEVPTREL